MSRRRVLLAIPAYDAIKPPAFTGLLEAVRGDFGVTFIPSLVVGTYTQVARDQHVWEARKHKCEEILWVDADMEPTPENFARILSHDVEIVSGCYTKRVAGDPQWTVFRAEGAPNGDLVPCNELPGGFLRVKMKVFDAFDHKYVDRRYRHDGENERMQYFPVQLCAHGAHLHPAELKLELVSSLLVGCSGKRVPGAVFDEILRVLLKKVPCEVTGDDCSFSRMARACGFTLWADLKCFLRHTGNIGFPAKIVPI